MRSMSAKVALARCTGYDDAEALRVCVDDLLANLGGIGEFVKPGQTVLIKPNLLLAAAPAAAVTTHPAVAREVIRLLKRQGAHVVVGDSPAAAGNIDEIWRQTGFGALCEAEAVPLINLEKAGSVPMLVNGRSFSIARPVLDADLVLNMPKIKTHVLTVLTGAVKNMYGAVPGLQKTRLHKLYPRPREFGELIAAIHSAVRPGLTIADAIVAMDGNGPSAGTPVGVGWLAASSDAAALDLAVCRLLGIDHRTVPYFRPLQKLQLCASGPEAVELLGDDPTGFPSPPFRTPSTLRYRLIPQWLVRCIRPHIWIHPRIGPSCARCGKCVQACPVGALTFAMNRSPVFDETRCIECCCCHEICPQHAIEMLDSPLLRLAKRIRAR